MLYAKGFSFLGRNSALCMHRYSMSLSDVFHGAIEHTINTFVHNVSDASAIVLARLLDEALKLRDGMLELPHGQFSLTMDDINDIIDFICTA
jgi:hypothetical protein